MQIENWENKFVYSILLFWVQILLGGLRTDLAHQRITLSDYLNLYSPALDWIMHCLVIQTNDAVLDDFLTKCQEKKNKWVEKSRNCSVERNFRISLHSNLTLIFISVAFYFSHYYRRTSRISSRCVPTNWFTFYRIAIMMALHAANYFACWAWVFVNNRRQKTSICRC